MAESKEYFDIAPFIDHTLLKPVATEEEIVKLCQEAIEHRFASVCVPPCYVKRAREVVRKTPVALGTVIGFPLGYQVFDIKMRETQKAIKQGAREIDAVINLAELKSGNYKKVKNEIEELSWLTQDEGCLLKVIIETAYLTRPEMERICEICAGSDVDYVKTSTGFAHAGAQAEDVRFLRQILPADIKIKASGGIKTYEQALELLNSGAERIGTSAGLDIIRYVQIS